MNYARVTIKVYTDNAGTYQQMPAILCEEEGRRFFIEPLIDYFLAFYMVRSLSWMKKVCQVTELLLDYMEANQGVFPDAESLFASFSQRMYTGTIGKDGWDPSGLYWAGKNTKNVRNLLIVMSEFSAWMYKEKYSTIELNPWIQASSYEARLAWAAHINQSKRSFLGHLNTSESASVVCKQARAVKFRQSGVGDSGPVKAFPDSMIRDLLFIGFLVPGATKKDDIVSRYDWRGICITLLLNFGGLRVSEPFHLWVGDVQADPNDLSTAAVHVYHPTDGDAPDDRKTSKEKRFASREAYLAVRYPNCQPRVKARGNYQAGWKNSRLDNTNKNFMKVHWFPTDGGRLFLQAYTFYMLQRMRAKIDSTEHPYLFVSFRKEHLGKPYTIRAFTKALERAVKRIGLPFGREHGTTEHSHRHGYGRRLRRAKTGEIVTMRALHHKSSESQKVYVDYGIDEVTAELEAASKALAAGDSLPMVFELDKFIEQCSNDQLYARRKF